MHGNEQSKRNFIRTLFVILGAVALVTAFPEIAGHVTQAAAQTSDGIRPEEREQSLRLIRQFHGTLTVIVQRNYLCGEEFEPMGKKNPRDVLSMALQHPDWAVKLDADRKQVVFMEEIDHFSVECGESVYFGIDRLGYLSVFAGLPARHKEIRTFYQFKINEIMDRLPAETRERLRKGIKVTDAVEYENMLSTFNAAAG